MWQTNKPGSGGDYNQLQAAIAAGNVARASETAAEMVANNRGGNAATALVNAVHYEQYRIGEWWFIPGESSNAGWAGAWREAGRLWRKNFCR